MTTYEKVKQELDKWFDDDDIDFSIDVVSCCYKAVLKQIPMQVVQDWDDESDDVCCPRCHGHLGSNEMVWEDFYDRGWTPMHCQECGQSMVWKLKQEI